MKKETAPSAASVLPPEPLVAAPPAETKPEQGIEFSQDGKSDCDEIKRFYDIELDEEMEISDDDINRVKKPEEFIITSKKKGF